MYIEIPQRLLAIAMRDDQLRLDPVLGVPDRFGLGNVLEQVQQQTLQHPVSATYFVLGVDRMRLLQQVFGAETGHQILHGIGQMLQRHCSGRAHICWLGGDMFAVVMLHERNINATELADALLALFRDPQQSWPRDAHVTVSMGVVAIKGAQLLPSAIIAAGETALREAKQVGRNGYVLHDVDGALPRQSEEAQNLLTARQVQRALQDETLYLAFQPVVCSRTGQVLFYEALARMRDHEGNPIAAARFIPAVEQFGLSYMLDCRVLRLAVAELKAHPELQLAVNIAATTSENPEWPLMLEEALQGRRDLAARLIIEITETTQIRDMAKARQFVDHARKLGGKVAIDDFGAGHTSVQHLTGLPINLMKIDRALVHNVHVNPQQQEVLRAMIALARSLGLHIVAEGVEDAEVATWLRDADVEMQQGYHFGHPQAERPWLAA